MTESEVRGQDFLKSGAAVAGLLVLPMTLGVPRLLPIWVALAAINCVSIIQDVIKIRARKR